MSFLRQFISAPIFFFATGVARRFPSLAGLIGVMPLTGALVLVWVYLENKGDQNVMQNYAVGALFGIAPSILFLLVALVGFKNGFPPHVVVLGGMADRSLGSPVFLKIKNDSPISLFPARCMYSVSQSSRPVNPKGHFARPC